MPAWVIEDPSAEGADIFSGNTALSHWKTVCGTTGEAHQIDPDCVEYRRSAETMYPANQEKEACRVFSSAIDGASQDLANRLSRRIWKDVNMPEQGLMPEYALFPAWNIFQEDDRPDELSFFNQMLDRIIDCYPLPP